MPSMTPVTAPLRFVQHAHIIEPALLDDVGRVGAAVSVAYRLYLDGHEVPWWGSYRYPLAYWDGMPDWGGNETQEWATWTLTGGNGQGTRLTLMLPANSIALDLEKRSALIDGRHEPLLAEDEAADLPDRLARAHEIHEAAPVSITMYVGRVTIGDLEDLRRAPVGEAGGGE